MNQIGYKNTEISYSEVGKGSAVVLLHGFLAVTFPTFGSLLGPLFTLPHLRQAQPH
jgi:hypothetical protein